MMSRESLTFFVNSTEGVIVVGPRAAIVVWHEGISTIRMIAASSMKDALDPSQFIEILLILSLIESFA